MRASSANREYVVLDVPVDARRGTAIRKAIRRAVSGTVFVRVATVNPEFLVRARRDPRFRDILLSADMRIADGAGIVFSAFLSGRRIFRFPGADLLRFVLGEADRTARSVLFVLPPGGLSSPESVTAAAEKEFPGLRVGALAADAASVPSEIVRSADIVFCSFGAPEQEYFLESLRGRPGNVRLAVGIGGAADFLSGSVRRAPGFMRFLGLEWLFRLVLSPRRIGRIWDAVVIFPFLRLSDRMKSGNREQ